MPANPPVTLFGLTLTITPPTPKDLSIIRTGSTKAGQADVRRPLESLRVRPDQYATLRVPGKSLRNTSAKGGTSAYTANLLIQNVNQGTTEKSQIAQTFDDDRVFFFGRNLDTLQVQAVLLENESFQWMQEWQQNFLDTLRGTKTADAGTRVELVVEDVQYFGYMTQFNLTRAATDRHMYSLGFTFVVTRTQFLRELRSTFSLPASTGATFGAALDAAAGVARRQLRSGKHSLADIASISLEQLENESAASRKGSTRQAFPAEYPNTPAGLPVDEVQRVTVNKAIRDALLSVPPPTERGTPNLFDLPVEEQDALVKKQILAPAHRATLRANPHTPRAIEDYVFDRYVPLIPTGSPPAVYQARQVGLGIVSLGVAALAATAGNVVQSGSFAGASDDFVGQLLARTGVA